MRQREPLSSLISYRLLKWSVVHPLFKTYFRGQIHGADNVPRTGPVIIVSNHASYFDPPLLSTAVCRPVAYMAKEELFQVPVLKGAISLYGAYPVKRGAGDRGAIRAALAALENGWAVGIFLEGTRTADGSINDPKPGAAMIAAKGDVPLLPVSLWGTEKILRVGKTGKLPVATPITIRIGELIPPPESAKREPLQEVTNRCAEVINELHGLGR
ncbi:MAG: 1-acyl-sn-glycerol-3-phosphate acyltransferase [Chroococcopsis gigantea SAG 12.99]|jgi:1-acyl-sn-glycerol-3-phosphate acyltransferase|nr:1-acyl-sn-glycerol-3-phosphate acyltransferase [Chlorogloea purpurea SAG 13.99]MDV3002275.1 1-acyl-sn-glycerol-3-phosphate acyltransferase [Chroococcopsis gigantea SAG 12.99]